MMNWFYSHILINIEMNYTMYLKVLWLLDPTGLPAEFRVLLFLPNYFVTLTPNPNWTRTLTTLPNHKPRTNSRTKVRSM